MEEWKEYKLKDVATLTTGFPFDGHKYAKEGIRVVRGDNVTIGNLRWDSDKDKRWAEPFERSTEYTLHAEDIVIGMDGSRVGKNRAQVKKEDLPLLIAQRVACVRHNELSLQKYLYYQIFSDSFEQYIKAVQTGTSIPHVSLKQIGDFPIVLPSISKQKRIAEILSSLDKKIEINRRINDNLEQQAQALFKSWFVDFEPFRDQPFVESELGMIPEGWRVGTIGELLDIKYGKDHKKLSDGEIPVYGSGGLMRKCECALYDGESVLIPRKGTLNNVMYVNEAFWTVDTMFYSIPKIDNVVLFTYLYLCGKDLASMNSGSAVPSMTTEILNNMQIVIPTEMVIRDFNIKVTSIYSRIKHGDNESRCLSQLRDTLLPRLMSSEIKVGDVTL
jgi:type I restriction enzyme S subunit